MNDYVFSVDEEPKCKRGGRGNFHSTFSLDRKYSKVDCVEVLQSFAVCFKISKLLLEFFEVFVKFR